MSRDLQKPLELSDIKPKNSDLEKPPSNKMCDKELSVSKMKKLFKKPSKKKIVINPELAPIEKIREQNIAERVALLKELGFCSENEQVQPRKCKSRPKLCTNPVEIRKSDRIKLKHAQ